MADRGLRKRSSTTSYKFNINQSLDSTEQLDQRHNSQFKDSGSHRGHQDHSSVADSGPHQFYEEQPPPPDKKKEKKKRTKKFKNTGEVELQSYSHFEPGRVPTAAVYETPTEPSDAADPEEEEAVEQTMNVTMKQQEERRGFHRQTSIVTLRLGAEPETMTDGVPPAYDTLPKIAFHSQKGTCDDLKSTEPKEPEKSNDSVQPVGRIEIAAQDRDKTVKDKTGGGDMQMEVIKQAPVRKAVALTAGSAAGNSNECTRVATTAGAVAAVKPAEKPAVKKTRANETAATRTTGDASSDPTTDTQPAEPEVMCCGFKVDPKGSFGKRINRHKSLGHCRPPGGPFPGLWRRFKGVCKKLSDILVERKWLFGVIIGALLLILFLILFPVSLVRLDYHEIALKRTKSTRYIDRDVVYYSGCYVLGPNTEFVTYPRSVHIEQIQGMSIFTSDRLELNFDVVIHYFIRPEELGTLNADYGIEYEPILTNIAFSTIKNNFIQFSLDQLLHARQYVETEIHKAVHRKLGGTCCMSCCSSQEGCLADRLTLLCEGCDPNSESCDQGQHVEVRHFHFGQIIIPSEIHQLLMASVIADVNAETESLLRDRVIVEKESERQVNEIHNEAREIDNFAAANASLTTWLARTEGHEVIVQNATLTGWDQMTSSLGITAEEYKLSLLLIGNLDKMENLIMAQDYSEKTNVPG